jgi:hypothetical protein
MGTAFGLDAIMPVIGDWQLVHATNAAPAADKTATSHAQERAVPTAAHTLSTREPS